MNVLTTKTDQAVQAARNLKLGVPAAVENALAMLDEVRRLGSGDDLHAPQLPADPAELHAVLAGAAKRRLIHQEEKRLASGLEPDAARAYQQAVRDAAAGWCGKLGSKFTETVKIAQSTSGNLSESLDPGRLDTLTSEQFRSYKRAQDAARQLSEIIAARVSIGTAAGEQPAPEKELAAVLAIDPPTRGDAPRVTERWQQLRELRDTWKAARDPITRWLTLVRTGEPLGLADLGQLPVRAAMLNAWRDSAVSLHSTFAVNGRTDLERVLERAETTYQTVATIPS